MGEGLEHLHPPRAPLAPPLRAPPSPRLSMPPLWVFTEASLQTHSGSDRPMAISESTPGGPVGGVEGSSLQSHLFYPPGNQPHRQAQSKSRLINMQKHLYCSHRLGNSSGLGNSLPEIGRPNIYFLL